MSSVEGTEKSIQVDKSAKYPSAPTEEAPPPGRGRREPQRRVGFKHKDPKMVRCVNVEEWLKLNADWDDTVTFQGAAPDPANPECEYGLWFFNQENKRGGYGRHFALRLKYLKKNREVLAWHLQIWNPWRKKQDREGEADESDAPSRLPIVGPVES